MARRPQWGWLGVRDPRWVGRPALCKWVGQPRTGRLLLSIREMNAGSRRALLFPLGPLFLYPVVWFLVGSSVAGDHATQHEVEQTTRTAPIVASVMCVVVALFVVIQRVRFPSEKREPVRRRDVVLGLVLLLLAAGWAAAFSAFVWRYYLDLVN